MFRIFDLPVSFLVKFDKKHKTLVIPDQIRNVTHRPPSYSCGTPEVSKCQRMVVFENKDVGDGACFMMIL